MDKKQVIRVKSDDIRVSTSFLRESDTVLVTRHNKPHLLIHKFNEDGLNMKVMIDAYTEFNNSLNK